MNKIYKFILLMFFSSSLLSMEVIQENHNNVIPSEINAYILTKLGNPRLPVLLKQMHLISLVNIEFYNWIHCEALVRTIANNYLEKYSVSEILEDIVYIFKKYAARLLQNETAIDKIKKNGLINYFFGKSQQETLDLNIFFTILTNIQNHPLMQCLLHDKRFLASILRCFDKKNYKDLFFESARKGHICIMKILLFGEHVPADIKNMSGSTALLCAALKGQLEVVEFLISYNKELNDANTCDNITTRNIVNEANTCGNTALICASQNNHINIVELLLSHNANVNIRNKFNVMALSWPVVKGNDELVSLLLSNGAEVNIADDNDATLLIQATDRGHEKIVRLLLFHQAEVNNKDKFGGTALICAAQSGYLEIAKLLLSHGANVNVQNMYKYTPLIWAAARNDIEMASLLLSNDADVNLQDNDGRTALMWAAANGNIEIVSLLLSKNADINVKDKWGITAFRIAVMKFHLKVAALLNKNA